MGDLDFVDLHADDLLYALFTADHPFEQKQFVCLRSVAIPQLCSGASVEVTIIAQSHVLDFRYGDLKLVEILACTPTLGLPSKGITQIAYAPVKGDAVFDFQNGGVQYKTEIRYEPLEAGWLKPGETPDDLKPAPNQLFLPFPQGDLPAVPFTGVRWRSGPASCHIYTQHSFPDDGVVVSTETTIIIDDADY